ncbi:MAG: nickel pincer cofactor biosynthesis protein LarC [Acidobacteria bacterium]|nr:nickel pincer cofactor biosynthesis protein LarC [Acidobacteriota bacterium]
MPRILYFDCFSGISGDMALGAMLDAGLPLDDLKGALGSLAVSGFDVSAARVLRAGVSSTKFTVHEHAEHQAPGTQHGTRRPHEHRHLPAIFTLIDQSALSAAGRERAKAMFQRLAEVEAGIHQMPVEKVHLHEVGALDSIIDIVGIVFALEWAGADCVVCSPLNVGGGMVQSAHGLFPVPAPATVELLGDAPVYAGAVQKELVTPTGALIVTSYAGSFGPIPAMSIERIGYGAGERDDPTTPNVLRVFIGRAAVDINVARTERVTVVECEIDDMNPQIFGIVMDQLYAAGALEVFYVPVQMKKNRPGTLLTVIAAPERLGQMSDIIFRETTTIGLRHSEVARECLDREVITVETPLGAVRFKVARRDGRVLNAVPEFEDCAKLAAAKNLPVKEVQALAVSAYKASRS